MPAKSSNIYSTIRTNKPKQEGKIYDDNGKIIATKRVLLLEDSHVRRVGESNSLSSCITAKGIDGLQSDHLISKHKGSINSNLPNVEDVIIHVGSNDISKGVKQGKVVDNIALACKRLREINPEVRILYIYILLSPPFSCRGMIHLKISILLRRTLRWSVAAFQMDGTF